MNTRNITAIAFATALLVSAPSRAASWDAVADFSPSNPNGAWSYGFDAGSGFVAYDTYVVGILPGLDGYRTSVSSHSGVPGVFKNVTGSTQTFSSAIFPNSVLSVHPGGASSNPFGGTDLDSIVRFTAPTAGNYKYSGTFSALDLYANNVGISAGSFSSSLVGGYGDLKSFSGVAALIAGGTIDFRVNRAGYYYSDSTGLAATITNSVPEPASWALLITGFGLTGSAMRRRRSAGRSLAVAA